MASEETKSVAKLGGTFLGLQVADIGLTLGLVGSGLAKEMNAVMAFFLEQPAWLLWSFKVGVAAIIVGVMIALADQHYKGIRWMLIAMIIIMTIVVLNNLYHTGVAIL